ncbi:MAG: tryptophan--tRNA ligase [Acidimicrobiales bacterium]
MSRVLSGLQPSGDLHLGNYLGAIRNWVADQDENDCFYCIVDLHALTLDISPDDLRSRTHETALDLLAAGLDPDRCTLFVQSHVAEHVRLAWLLECITTMGELRRMTQFKDKSAGKDSVRVGLFTYPVLQAADILLYDADRVPVGDDQRQHLELAREVAIRFNHRFGRTFVVPEAAIPAMGARVMDLQHPERKMSKSVNSPLGTVQLLDQPEAIVRKVKRAVTDTDGEVRYDPGSKPGVSNLLELLAVSTGRTPNEVAGTYVRYGDLKADTAEALVELLRPVRDRRAALAAEPRAVASILARGAAKAQAVAGATYGRAAEAIGLLAPGSGPG